MGLTQSAPLQAAWEFVNDDAASHEKLTDLLKAFKEASASSKDVSAEMKEALAKMEIPAVGEKFTVLLPQQLINQLNMAYNMVRADVDTFKENHTEAEVAKLEQILIPSMIKATAELTKNYVTARDEVEKDVKVIKSFFRSQKEDTYKTKADVLRALWAELPKYLGKPVPPVDEEILAELEQFPAVQEGEFRHNWGIADKLYKSEAIDSFGQKYLLGVFDTFEEAQKAFKEWNAEYEKGRADMKSKMEQWSKQENARLESDTSGADRIKKILEEARR